MKPQLRERRFEAGSVWADEERPRLDIRPIEKTTPKEQAGSLLKLLDKSNDLTLITQTQIKTVRRMYLSQLMDKKVIAEKLGVKYSIIDGWVTLFGWEEERTRQLQDRMSQLIGKTVKHSPDFRERCDRIFANFESIVEEFLQSHHDLEDAKLSPRDLKTLQSVAKDCLEIRMNLHGQSPKKESKVTVDMNSQVNVDVLHSLGSMVVDAVGQNPTIKDIESKKPLSIEVVDSPESDEAYEDLE